MKSGEFISRVMLLLVAFLIAVCSADAQDDKFSYKGFTVDVAAIRSSPNASVLRETLQQQIDIVENVHLRPEQRDFFKTVPIIVIAAESGPPELGGFYVSTVTSNGRDRRIVIRSYFRSSPTTPALLHELLHAYHEQRLAGGLSNPEVEKLYTQAKAQQRFPADSYMLSNVNEYFAMVASAFLHGMLARDPFTRENLKDKQPDCYAWLEREFGPMGNAPPVTQNTPARRVQTPSPGAEAALRRLIVELQAGKPRYDLMTGRALQTIPEQLEQIQAALAMLGAVESVEFNGATPSGINIYDAKFEHGLAQWSIWLDGEGKTQLLTFRPQ